MLWNWLKRDCLAIGAPFKANTARAGDHPRKCCTLSQRQRLRERVMSACGRCAAGVALYARAHSTAAIRCRMRWKDGNAAKLSS